ncbi:hypothetical protein BDZ91DRAFT_344120 [Kalaharituber pfeilii]|nr:hypothetical protein BDZ91DRAFT_344120 [Kalaharituber pfeilii]
MSNNSLDGVSSSMPAPLQRCQLIPVTQRHFTSSLSWAGGLVGIFTTIVILQAGAYRHIDVLAGITILTNSTIVGR